jgi:hypothetical protein
MASRGGEKGHRPLEMVGTVRQAQHRHHRALLAGPEVFRHAEVLHRACEARAARQGGAVPGPDRQAPDDEASGETRRVVLRGRPARLPGRRSTANCCLPEEPFVGQLQRHHRSRRLGGAGLPEGASWCRKLRQPDPDRAGRHPRQRPAHRPADAMREFCEFRNLLPRGVKLAPEDVWDRCCLRALVKMQDPQFSGQTKERLSSRSRGLRLRRGQGRLQPVAEPAHRKRREDRRAGDQQCAQRA